MSRARLDRLERSLLSLLSSSGDADRCHCRGVTVDVNHGDPIPDICPRCGKREPTVMVIEEVIVARGETGEVVEQE